MFAKQNAASVPYYAIGLIGSMAALLAALGDLGTLVEAASLIFLLTFSIVNTIAFLERVRHASLCLLGAVLCGVAIVVASVEQFLRAPLVMAGTVLFVLLVFAGRRWLASER